LNLIKTSLYTSVSTAVTFISGFIVTKVVAVKIGPSGVAYVGQYQNIIAILMLLATGAIAAGVVKYLATYKDDKEKKQQVITTALGIIIVCSAAVSLFVICASTYLSKSIFHTEDFWPVFALYAAFVTIIALNTLIAAVFNGLKQIKKLTIVNICGSLFGIGFTITFANAWGVTGVLIASNFTALAVFLLNLWLLRDIRDFSWKPSLGTWHKKMLLLLFAFTLMNIVSGFLSPFTQLMIRDKIIQGFSIEEAGYWQAITKISDYYLTFITSVLSVYYIPRLSEINDNKELRKEVIKGYKIILPAVALMALALWVGRSLVVYILFTPKFLPMLPLFKFQLIGDVLKIGSWLIAIIMITRALTKTFIITEILFSASLIVLSYWMINEFGIIGATYAFSINYGVYWLLMWILMKKYLR